MKISSLIIEDHPITEQTRYVIRLGVSVLFAVAVVIAYPVLALKGLELPVIARLDAAAQRFVSGIASPEWSILMKGITSLGGYTAIAVVGIVTTMWLWIRKRRRDLLAWGVTLVGGLGCLYFFKTIVQRPRPTPQLILAQGFSFPSGHAVVSVLVYGFLAALIWKGSAALPWRIAGVLGLSVLIGLIGFSRIYFNVHYTTDVVGGFVFGMTWLALTQYTIRAPNHVAK